jgi:hypothetical protein
MSVAWRPRKLSGQVVESSTQHARCLRGVEQKKDGKPLASVRVCHEPRREDGLVFLDTCVRGPAATDASATTRQTRGSQRRTLCGIHNQRSVVKEEVRVVAAPLRREAQRERAIRLRFGVGWCKKQPVV